MPLHTRLQIDIFVVFQIAMWVSVTCLVYSISAAGPSLRLQAVNRSYSESSWEAPDDVYNKKPVSIYWSTAMNALFVPSWQYHSSPSFRIQFNNYTLLTMIWTRLTPPLYLGLSTFPNERKGSSDFTTVCPLWNPRWAPFERLPELVFRVSRPTTPRPIVPRVVPASSLSSRHVYRSSDANQPVDRPHILPQWSHLFHTSPFVLALLFTFILSSRLCLRLH